MATRPKKKIGKQVIKIYHCKTAPLSGHRFADIIPQSRRIFRTLQKQTKRRPYVRSSYFHKDKIFFDFFWEHMKNKSIIDRTRRLKYLPCALELLRNSRHDPITFIDVGQPNIIKHEFAGMTKNGPRFTVIVQENRKTDKKQLLSLYPLRS